MADPKDSSLQFFQKATPRQWVYILSHYKEVLRLHAVKTRGSKKNGPEELIKLDTWFQETLPKSIHARKDVHMTHEELVQVAKWKLSRGKSRARILDLVRINTELAVKQTTQKAFKKGAAGPSNLYAAMNALTTLKGIGPQTASAVLCAAYPQYCPYMADETMLATPGVEATDYTLNEFVNYATQIQKCTDKLNGDIKSDDPDTTWTPHKVEMALWVHYLAKDLNPSILDALPLPDGSQRPSGDAGDDDDVVTHVKVEEACPSTVDDNITNSHNQHDDEDDAEVSSTEGAESRPLSATNGNGSHLVASEEDSNSNSLLSVPTTTSSEAVNLNNHSSSLLPSQSSSSVDNGESMGGGGSNVDGGITSTTTTSASAIINGIGVDDNAVLGVDSSSSNDDNSLSNASFGADSNSASSLGPKSSDLSNSLLKEEPVVTSKINGIGHPLDVANLVNSSPIMDGVLKNKSEDSLDDGPTLKRLKAE